MRFEQKKKAVSPSRYRRAVWLAVGLSLALIGTGCGDVYRPVAQPIIGPPPNPGALHFVAAITTDGPADPGSASRIDVSGDSVEGTFPTGVLPTHAALVANGTRLYVTNTAEDTVSANNTSTPTLVTAISLPPGSKPAFVHTTESANVYVANSGNNTVSVINATSNVVTATVAVGSNPSAMAELPNGQKLYVLNKGSGDVTVINTIDDTVATTIALPGASSPSWIAARSDSSRVYVLDGSGLIYDISAVADPACPVPDVVCGTVSSGGSGSNFLVYDSTSNSLLVTNSSADSVSALNASVDPPMLRAGSPIAIPIPAIAGYPCQTTPVPAAVTVLPDGRAYVASYQLDAGLVCTQSTVIDTAVGTIKSTIPLASQAVDTTNATGCGNARFRVFTVASGGGTTSNFKVYVSQCDAGNTAVIDTFATTSGVNPHPADVFAASIGAPLSSFPPQQLAISGATEDKTDGTTTYSYSQTSGSGLQIGMRVFVTGMTDAGNNGVFTVSAVDTAAGTFAVSNPLGVSTTSSQNGQGTVMPAQNPVFLVAGP
jgi:YVTN family beta-propeller protein